MSLAINEDPDEIRHDTDSLDKDDLLKKKIQNCKLGLVARKPVFRVSNKARLKPYSSATGLGRKLKFHLCQV